MQIHIVSGTGRRVRHLGGRTGGVCSATAASLSPGDRCLPGVTVV
jgi:hypothetical protein